jgi:hypothetical protein
MDQLVRIVTVVVSSAAIALYLAVHSARPHARCEGRRNCFFAAHNHVPREKTTASMRMRRSIRACGARTAPAAATLTAGNGSGGTMYVRTWHGRTLYKSTAIVLGVHRHMHTHRPRFVPPPTRRVRDCESTHRMHRAQPDAETRMGARRRIRLYLYRAAKAWAHYHRGRGLMHA